MKLSPEEVWLFRMNGYIKFPEPFPEETVAKLKEAINADIQAEREPLARENGKVARLSEVLDRSQVFLEAATSPLVLDPLEDLIGPNIELVHNRHNHASIRQAGSGRDRLHRDVPHWTRGLVTVLMYLEEASAERGCTQLVPGSHLLPWAAGTHADSVTGGGFGDRLARQVARVESPAGGLLAIDSLIWHAVGTNKTEFTRTTLTFGYHAPDTLATVEQPSVTLVRGERTYTGHREAAKA